MNPENVSYIIVKYLDIFGILLVNIGGIYWVLIWIRKFIYPSRYA